MAYVPSVNLQCIPQFLRTVFHVEGTPDGLMTKSMTVILFVLSLLAIAMNLGVVTRITKLRKRVYDYKPAFILIGNLAVSDFLVGFFVFVFFCLDLSEFSTDWKDQCCGLFTAISVFACQETIFTIVLIAIDKYIFICHGLAYARIVTTKRTYIMLCASWFYSVLIAISPAIGLREEVWCTCNFQEYISKTFAILLFMTSIVIPLAIMGSLYAIILSVAIKLSKSRNTYYNKGNKNTKLIRLSLISRFSKTSRTKTTLVTTSTAIPSCNSSINVNHENEILTDQTSSEISDTENDVILNGILTSVMENIQDDCNHKKDISSNEIAEYDKTEYIEYLQNDEYNSYSSNIEVSRTPVINSEFKLLREHMQSPEIKFKTIECVPLTENENCVQIEEVDETNQRIIPSKAQSLSIPSNGKNVPKMKKRMYFKSILNEARNKAVFFRRVKATKTLFLIIGTFILTYGPFIIGTLVYKSQSDKKSNLFQLLNNLLYCAVIGNSVINPFIYAYGYKEFRLRTKKFKGIFARERTPKL